MPIPRLLSNAQPPLLLRRPMLAGVLVALILFSVTGYLSWSYYQADVQSSEEQAQWNMVNQATIISQMIDGDIHRSFTQPEQSASPEYQEILRRLEKTIAESRHIKYLYTYILKDDRLHYIFDVEDPKTNNGANEHAIMRLETEEPGKMRAAVLSRKAFAETVTNTSTFGELISAYAPILDSKGQFVAMLGIDLTAKDYIALTKGNRTRFYDTILLYALLSSFAGMLTYLLARNFTLSMRHHHEQQRQTNRFMHAVQSSPDAFFLFDYLPPEENSREPGRLVLTEVNQAGCTLCELPRQSLLGRDGDHTVPFGKRYKLSQKLAQAFQLQQVSMDTINTEQDKNFAPAACDLVISPREGGVTLFLRDITERKRADSALKESQQQMDLLAQALRQSPNGVMIADGMEQDAPIIFVNPAFTNITGYSDKDVLGKNLRFLQGRDTAQPALQILRKSVRVGEHCRVLLRNYRKDGMMFWNDLSISPIINESGNVTHFIGVMSDVTEHRNAQEMLQFTNHELQRKNAALDDALIAANQAAQAKRSFLTNVGHEIRTPMNGVVGMADLLAETPMNEEQKTYLMALRESSKALLMIVSDILDFSRIDSGQATLYKSWFSPADLIRDAVQDVEISMQAKGLTITIRIDDALPPAIHADYERLKQVVENYLSNAIKFSSNGTITVGVNAVTTDKQNKRAKILFFVADEGIGISENDKSKIFEIFSQIDNSDTRSYGGSGLGLALCRQIAKLMHGEVGFQSVRDQGSTFWFEAEFAYGNAQALRRIHQNLPLNANAVRFDGKTALLVEDNPVNQLVAQAILEKLGFTVATAVTGQEASDMFQQQTFDIVLMDIQLPVMDGIQATKAIREFEKKQQRDPTPILGVTANVLESYRESCFEVGMDDYLAKPLEKVKMLTILARHIMPDVDVVVQKTAAKLKSGIAEPEGAATEAMLDNAHLESISTMLGDKITVLVERFESDTSAQLDKMREAIEADSAEELALIAHSLKSAASNIGAHQLSAVLRHVELHAKDDFAHMAHYQQQARAKFDDVMTALHAFLKKKKKK